MKTTFEKPINATPQFGTWRVATVHVDHPDRVHVTAFDARDPLPIDEVGNVAMARKFTLHPYELDMPTSYRMMLTPDDWVDWVISVAVVQDDMVRTVAYNRRRPEVIQWRTWTVDEFTREKAVVT